MEKKVRSRQGSRERVASKGRRALTNQMFQEVSRKKKTTRKWASGKPEKRGKSLGYLCVGKDRIALAY